MLKPKTSTSGGKLSRSCISRGTSVDDGQSSLRVNLPVLYVFKTVAVASSRLATQARVLTLSRQHRGSKLMCSSCTRACLTRTQRSGRRPLTAEELSSCGLKASRSAIFGSTSSAKLQAGTTKPTQPKGCGCEMATFNHFKRFAEPPVCVDKYYKWRSTCSGVYSLSFYYLYVRLSVPFAAVLTLILWIRWITTLVSESTSTWSSSSMCASFIIN